MAKLSGCSCPRCGFEFSEDHLDIILANPPLKGHRGCTNPFVPPRPQGPNSTYLLLFLGGLLFLMLTGVVLLAN